MVRLALVSSALLFAAAQTPAREIELIGKHQLSGVRDGQRYTGTLEILDDASYSCERSFAGGRVEREAGTARIVLTSLVLEAKAGARTFELGTPNGDQRWSWTGKGASETLTREVERENVKRFVRRLGRDGKPLRWILQNNRGYVERGEEWIQRSRQPSPRDIDAFRKAGGRTVLSLNGDQDKDVDDVRLENVLRLRSPQGESINLRSYIAKQGLNHVHVNMSAQRAPSDAELVTVFRTLLDDAQRPVLVHCKGGSDRTGVVGALYAYEFLGATKAEAKATMRAHMWAAVGGTEIQGAYFDLYRKGRIRELLAQAGVTIPERYRSE